MIRKVTAADAKDICAIYNHYVLNSVITFEKDEVSEKDMAERITTTTKKLPWYVFVEDGKVIGYSYVSEWKSRCAYQYSLESTVYLHQDAVGKGVGTQLYKVLIDEVKSMGYHALIGGIALPNEASVALHEKFGYEKVAQFKEVGYKFDQWIDVGYWELLFK